VNRLGIRTRLAAFYTGVFTVVLTLFAALSYQLATRELKRQSDVRLDQVAAGLRGYLRFENGRPYFLYNPQDREERFFVTDSAQYSQLYDAADGHLVQQSEASRLASLALSSERARTVVARLAADTRMQYTRESEFDFGEKNGPRMRFHNAEIRDSEGRAYLLRVGTPLAPLDAALKQIAGIFVVMLPVGMLVAGLGGWWMARSALKPVDNLRAAAQSINISQLQRRLPLRGTHDELDRLAQTFNEVFARLEQAVDQMKQFTAGIAHELRTPLSVLQGEAELALMSADSVEEYRNLLTGQLAQFEKLSRMFNQLLLLARAEAGELQLAARTVDLSEMVRFLIEQMTPIAEDKSISLHVQDDNVGQVIGDSEWLERIVVNLLDNAIKFTPSGGRVTVTVSARGSQVALEVRDTGIGIPAEALPHIFDRFFRVDSSRSADVPGVGLGLTLVKWAVEAQGGSIQVESAPEAGTCFTVLMPLAAATSVGPERKPQTSHLQVASPD
jgi:heavy metal sensor kinase